MLKLSSSLAALAKTIPASATERVIVFRYDKIGDLLVTSPLFRAIKEKDPKAYIILVCSAYNRAALENMPEIDRLITYDPKAAYTERVRFAWALRKLKPTTIFVMSPSSGGHWMGWLSGASKRAGMIMSYRRLQIFLAPLLLTASEIINREHLNEETNRSYHISEIALRLAASCGFPRPKTIAQSAPTTKASRAWASQIASGERWPAKRILLHLGATWGTCGLLEEQVATLALRLYDDFPDATLLMTAGPTELSYFGAVNLKFIELMKEEPSTFSSPSFKFFPRALLLSDLSLNHWSALIESANVVVTPDTGAVHMASAHQRPVVAVYAPERFNSMTSLFGPWETPYKTLRGGGVPEDLTMQIVEATRTLLTEAAPVA